MQFMMSTQEMNGLLSKLQNVVGSKVPMPILNNICIRAYNDELVLTTSDLTVGMRCVTGQAKIVREGATTLPVKKFAQLVRELTVPTFSLNTNSHEVTEIAAGASRFKLHGMNISEYPQLPDIHEANKIVLPQKKLKQLLYGTSFAVSREDTRYVLTGVNLTLRNQILTFVGTDGRCLARMMTEVNSPAELTESYNIPSKAIDEVIKILGEEGEASLYLLSDKIAVEVDGTMVITKLLSGDYPDINRVIPASPSLTVTFHREELMTLLRQIALFTDETTHSVRFTMTNGELTLSANTREVGEGKVRMPLNYSGDKFEIAFNPSYLLNILKHCQAESVLCGLEDPYNPCVIVDREGGALKTDGDLIVLMPMRLSEE